MIGGKRVVAIIPARGGSKSVPDKNLQPLGGKPLIVWSIEAAKAAESIDRVVVSTDSRKIGDVAGQHGAEVEKRPTALATDDALVIDAIRYHLRNWQRRGEEVDIVLLLEPTCPLRSPKDIEACLRLMTSPERGYDSVATFTEAELNPHRAWKMRNHHAEPFIAGAVPWLPRQQLPPAFQLNGAVYAFFSERLPADSIAPFFGKTAAVLMPRERSVDVDVRLDFELAEVILREEHGA